MCRAGGLQVNSSLYRPCPESPNAIENQNKKAVTKEKVCAKLRVWLPLPFKTLF